MCLPGNFFHNCKCDFSNSYIHFVLNRQWCFVSDHLACLNRDYTSLLVMTLCIIWPSFDNLISLKQYIYFSHTKTRKDCFFTLSSIIQTMQYIFVSKQECLILLVSTVFICLISKLWHYIDLHSRHRWSYKIFHDHPFHNNTAHDCLKLKTNNFKAKKWQIFGDFAIHLARLIILLAHQTANACLQNRHQWSNIF